MQSSEVHDGEDVWMKYTTGRDPDDRWSRVLGEERVQNRGDMILHSDKDTNSK
jgi:hypothetical protein